MRLASFGTLALITLLLMVASIAEKICGTEAVVTHIYTSWWMIALWTIAAVTGIAYLCRHERRFTSVTLHTSFLIILMGAFTTHLTGIEGKIHLREGMPPTKELYTDEGRAEQLPFTLSFVDFTTEHYPGTTVPMDYVTRLIITDKQGTPSAATVSMNRIAKHRHWRIYQTDHDADGRGSLLTLVSDRYGIGLTYCGYLLLFISLIAILINPKGGFRHLLRHVVHHRALRYIPLAAVIVAIGSALLVATGAGVDNTGYVPPVLRSPYLGIHVTLIMAAYIILMVNMLIGIVAEVLRHSRSDYSTMIARLALTSRLLLYPAVAMLATGIFIGAVWANVSWGRYWGWDPKEVWALVTMIVYAAPLHSRSLAQLTRPTMLHRYCIAAFLCVIATYFGVNYLLGGLHSYA